MAFHLGFELPKPQTIEPEEELLTPFEVEIIQKQIRKNSLVVDSYIERIHLFVNRERYPKNEVFVQKIRARMFLLMEENDTFRRLLWRHFQGRAVRTVNVAE